MEPHRMEYMLESIIYNDFRILQLLLDSFEQHFTLEKKRIIEKA